MKPVVNKWYTNLTGKLFKVRLLSHCDGIVVHMTIEYTDGNQQIISKEDWDMLYLREKFNENI